MLKKLIHAAEWCVKHWAISLAGFLVVAISITTAVCWHFFQDRPTMVPVYVTVSGLGEGKDMVKREIFVEDGENVADIFSLDYPEIYEEFRRPYIANNRIVSFQGVSATVSKKFDIALDGQLQPVPSQAYIWEGVTITITYR